MHYFGKLGPMLGKVAIQVKVPAIHDSRIKAKLLLPDGSLFENKAFDLLITKSDFINTLNDRRSLLEWASEWGRKQAELKGAKNPRNSVFYEVKGNEFLLAFESTEAPVASASPKPAVTTCSAVRPPQIQKNAAVKQAHARPGELNTRIAREFLYRQLNRLALCTPGELPAEPGIYAVFEPGQRIGARIEGLPQSRFRCMKIGMTNKTIRSRISSQYCGKSHRSAVPRMHVGDALIGQAIKRSRDLAGIAVCDLVDFRKLWNVPGSDGNVLKKHPVMCSKMGLRDANAVRALETPLESLVSDVVGEWRFVGIPASAADIDLIEDRANSLLSDLSAFDPPSENWLGLHSKRRPIRDRGLWAFDGVQFGKLYERYTSHPKSEGRRDEDGQPIADWLGRFADLISQATD